MWQQAAGVPLPAILKRSILGYEVVLSQKMDELWNTTPVEGCEEPAGDFNPLNEVYKLLGVWWVQKPYLYHERLTNPRSKVQRYLDQHQHYSWSQKQTDISSLSVRAIASYSMKGRLDGRAAREIKDTDLLRHCLYHLCQIMLYSSVVPLFSPQPVAFKIPPSQVNASARVVLKSTIAMATLFKLRVQEKDGLRAISPLAAYVAFVTGSVLVLYGRVRSHMRIQISEDIETVPGVGSEEMESIRQILRTLKVHWWSVARLVWSLLKQCRVHETWPFLLTRSLIIRPTSSMPQFQPIMP